MRVFKFGGASTAHAEGVRNVAEIIRQNLDQELVVVISAMGKTTNELEALLDVLRAGGDPMDHYRRLRESHLAILYELFPDRSHPVYSEMESLFFALLNAFKLCQEDYDYHYDQLVGMGEMLSSKMVSHYLQSVGVDNRWLDVRQCIATDSSYREGQIDWPRSEKQILDQCGRLFSTAPCLVTQGFLGSNDGKKIVTLGREGSDYSASIFSYCLQATDVTIWKDVPGFLNADPRYFANPQKLDEISYSEAIELSYFGASIIHPKSLKPLQNRRIPLYVKSFINPAGSGSVIQGDSDSVKGLLPCYICKTKQVLISIYPKDFSFIAEQNLSYIFFLFAEHNIRINLIQNSALSFSVCVDENKQRMDDLVEALSNKFKVKYNDNLQLMTVRNYREEDIKALGENHTIFLEQRNRTTAQMVIRLD